MWELPSANAQRRRALGVQRVCCDPFIHPVCLFFFLHCAILQGWEHMWMTWGGGYMIERSFNVEGGCRSSQLKEELVGHTWLSVIRGASEIFAWTDFSVAPRKRACLKDAWRLLGGDFASVAVWCVCRSYQSVLHCTSTSSLHRLVCVCQAVLCVHGHLVIAVSVWIWFQYFPRNVTWTQCYETCNVTRIGHKKKNSAMECSAI